MVRTIMNSTQLRDLIDVCIEDLKEGGAKLIDLAQLFCCLGEATGKESFTALMPVIGSFGSEVLSFRPFVAFPLLPDETRKKYQGLFNDALKDGEDALKIIREELCSKNSPDPKQIIKAIAMLSRHDYNLTMARQLLLRSRQSSIGSPE